jgi:hypothetical protein
MLPYAGHRGLNGDATELHSFAMSTMNVHDIYLEACAMQHEGISTTKIAGRVGNLGADNELTPIETGGGDGVHAWRFNTGEIIRFDGHDFSYLRHQPCRPP